MKYDPSTAPSPEQMLAARTACGLTQEQAAQLVHRGGRNRWNEWEAGSRHMKADTWELFLLKTGLHPTHQLKEKSA
ncbi:MAG: helix-turn-helix domain-containing protein [Telluria sp.]